MWASARQTPRVPGQLLAGALTCLPAMVWAPKVPPVPWQSMYGTASGLVHPQPRPGPQFTALLGPGWGVTCELKIHSQVFQTSRPHDDIDGQNTHTHLAYHSLFKVMSGADLLHLWYRTEVAKPLPNGVCYKGGWV